MTTIKLEEVEKTELEFVRGSSNKLYTAILLKGDGGYRLQFKYGARYGTKQSNFKPKLELPTVTYGEASLLYHKQIEAKLKKGYTRR